MSSITSTFETTLMQEARAADVRQQHESEFLRTLIRSKRWDQVATYIRSKPSLLKNDSVGYGTPMHYIAMFNPSNQVVQTMLQFYPYEELIRNTTSWNAKSGCGGTPCNVDKWTPLHIACAFNSDHVIRGIINSVTTSTGCELLHIRDQQGRTPLFILTSFYARKIKQYLQTRLETETGTTKEICDKPPSNASDQLVERICSNILLLIHASRHCKHSSDAPNILLQVHTAIACTPNFPNLDILRYVMCKYSHQLALRDNKDYNLPIHIACDTDNIQRLTKADHHGDIPTRHAHDKQHCSCSLHRGNAIRVILESDRLCAQYKNRHGELPLHLALKSQANKSFYNGIKQLCEAYPYSLTVQDRTTLLYPFMLAAVARGKTASEVEEKAECTCRLSTIYSLLRACPEMERFTGFRVQEDIASCMWRHRRVVS